MCLKGDEKRPLKPLDHAEHGHAEQEDLEDDHSTTLRVVSGRS